MPNENPLAAWRLAQLQADSIRLTSSTPGFEATAERTENWVCFTVIAPHVRRQFRIRTNALSAFTPAMLAKLATIALQTIQP
jgi:hypothetical protein